MRKTRDKPETFWAKVAVGGPHECWLWQASKCKMGYGQVWWRGRPRVAHRVVLMLMGIHVPESQDVHVHHRCGVKACCNPDHLEVMSRAQHSRIHWKGCQLHGETFMRREPAGRRRCSVCRRLARVREKA